VSDQPGSQNDWIRYAHLSDEQRLLVRRRSNAARIVVSVILIGAGVLLFLSNLGILPVRHVWILWPALPIGIGVAHMVNARNSGSRVWGLFLILFGSLFLFLNLGWIHIRSHDGSWPFSLLLIGAGCAALFNAIAPTRSAGVTPRAFAGAPSRAASFENAVNDFVLFGGLKRKLETYNFQGGDLTTIFGNIEVDLRPALITPEDRSAVLNVTAVFGAAKIRVPQSWRVSVSGAGILGNFEDKTIPPNTGPDAPTLIITGLSLFSSVEIED